MLGSEIFKAIGALALGAKAKRDAEVSQFLAFYRSLVETVDTEVVRIFGTMNGVSVTQKDGSKATWGIELTATDFLWWKSKLEAEGARLDKSPAAVKSDMFLRLSKRAEEYQLSADDRKRLIALIEQAEAL